MLGTNVSMLRLRVASLQGNQLTGPLPAAWAAAGVMPQLEEMYLQVRWAVLPALPRRPAVGSQPQLWGGRPCLAPHLRRNSLPQDNQLTGGLPEEWGSWENEGLPVLRVFNASNNPLGGTLPYQWSQRLAFPSLKTL